MRHLWLALAVFFFLVGGVRLLSIETQPPRQGATSPPSQPIVGPSPIPTSTPDPCAPPSDVSEPGRWWLGCWDTDAAGNWRPFAPEFYFDGVSHRFDTPEEYVEKLQDFKRRGSNAAVVDRLIATFSEAIRKRHPLSVKTTGENAWTVTVPKGRVCDTGIPITANMSLDVYADESFQATVANQVFSGEEIVLVNRYALGVGFYEDSTVNYHPSWPVGSEKLPGVSADFFATLKLQVNEQDHRQWLEFTVKTKPNLYDAEMQLMRNDPAHAELHRAAEEKATRLRERIASR